MRGHMWGSQLSHRWVPLQTKMLNAFSHPMCSSSWLVLIPQEFTKHKEDVFDIIYMSWKTRAMLHIIYGSLKIKRNLRTNKYVIQESDYL